MDTCFVSVYGHNFTVKEISALYPFNDNTVDVFAKYPMDTITFDIKLAMELRLKGYVALEWGCLCRGRRVFVFKKERMVVLPF